MPEPISSSSRSSEPAGGYDSTLDESGRLCRGEVASSSPPEASGSTTPAVDQLVSSVSRNPAVLPPPTTNAASSAGSDNAQRTTERVGIAPYAAAGKTGTGDSLYVGVAALKGHDSKSGLDVEVLSASEQKGLQMESQAALLRAGWSDSHASWSVEALTIRGTHGIHNDDGSTGYNVMGLATAVGAEGTLVRGANSLTAGLSIGAGAAGSIGFRDIDHDGRPEICVKGSLGYVTLGACVELP